MSKDKEVKNPVAAVSADEDMADRKRERRKKVYERVREAQIPDNVRQYFADQGYDIKLVRWILAGEEQLSYLARRESEGYEFVNVEELPKDYARQLRIQDSRSRRGLVTVGDLCLMKIDSELRESRRDYYNAEADRQIAAHDIHVLEKKGFRNFGSRSKVLMREPTFRD